MPSTFGTIDAPTIAERIREIVKANVPVISGTVTSGIEREFREWLRGAVGGIRQDDENNAGGMSAEYGEIDAIRGAARSEREWSAATGAKRKSHEHRVYETRDIRP